MSASTDPLRTAPLPRPLLACAAITLVTLASLWPLVTHDFVDWDDPHTVWKNRDFYPPTPTSVARYWTVPAFHLYIPVTYTVWGLLATVARVPRTGVLDPHVYHAANLIVHIAAAMLVWKILDLLLPAGRRRVASLVGALVFAVHPVQVEAVAWVSGMKDLLCGFFSLLAVYQYLLAAGGHAKSLRRAYVFASAAFVLAILSKPTGMVVPAIAAALDVVVLRRPWRAVARSVAPWLVLSVAAMIATKLIQPTNDVPSPLWARPLVAADALAFYARQVVFPLRLAIDYGRTPSRLIQSGAVYLTWIVPAGIAVALWLGRRRTPVLLAAAAVFIIGVSPVLGFVPFDYQLNSTVADHYMYLSMLGVALAVAWVVAVPNESRAAVVTAGVLVVLLGARAWVQTWTWRDTPTLLNHAVAVNPGSVASHMNLTMHALEHDDPSTALRHARAAARLAPGVGGTHLNLALALHASDDPGAAIASLRRAIELMPDDQGAQILLGRWLEQRPDATTRP